MAGSYRGRKRKLMVSGRNAQTNLATAAAVDMLLRVSSQPGNIEPEVTDDSDLIGGYEEPTTQELDVRHYKLPFAQSKLKPNTLAFAMAYALGSVSSSSPAGATTARLHTFTPKDDTEFDTFTVEEFYATGYQRKYIGCIFDSFTLTGSRRQFFSLDGQIYGSGKYAAGTASVTEISEPSIHPRDAVVFVGSAYAGTTPDQDKSASNLSGASDKSAKIDEIRWGYNNNTDLDFLPHFNSGTTWGRAEREDRSQELSMTVLFEDLTEANRAIDQSTVAIQLKHVSGTAVAGIPGYITGNDATYKYGFSLIWPKIMYSRANITGSAGDRVRVDITGNIKQHATYGSVKGYVWNGVFAYAQ